LSDVNNLSIETAEQASLLREFHTELRDVMSCELGGDYVASSIYRPVLEQDVAGDRNKLQQLRERMSVTKKALLQAGFKMPTDWLVLWPPPLTIEEGDPIIHVSAKVDQRIGRISEEVEAFLIRWDSVGRIFFDGGSIETVPQIKKVTKSIDMESDESKWFTLQEAADYLRVSCKQLRQRCNVGKIKFRREGRRGRNGAGEYRFRRDWLDEYIDVNTTVRGKKPTLNETNPPSQLKQRQRVHIPESEWGSSLGD
jgi:hypothetical protein